jgi:gluconate 2-dehydrogenase gamma chain
MPGLSRRRLLASTAVSLLPAAAFAAHPGVISGGAPWAPDSGTPPEAASPGAWRFFTHREAIAVTAIVDRLIPADDLSVGGGEAGCAIFIDRQLAGPYGRAETLYMRPPFMQGLPQQGFQSDRSPAQLYRAGLAALDAYCKASFLGKSFAELPVFQQDSILTGLENGAVRLDGVDGPAFFDQLLQNTIEGFFADPIYGGNRDMAGWRLIGFPGARYDYRDHLATFDAPYDRPPVGLRGGPGWSGSL